MKSNYHRIFGRGPLGLLVSVILLKGARVWAEFTYFPELGLPVMVRKAVFAAAILVTIIVVFWSVRSLPPEDRGRELCTSGAFRYFRHPLYAGFLTFFNFGLALYLNHWIFIVWALLLHPIWHWIIRGEEDLMHQAFPDQYDAYCARTGRFFPRFFSMN